MLILDTARFVPLLAELIAANHFDDAARVDNHVDNITIYGLMASFRHQKRAL